MSLLPSFDDALAATSTTTSTSIASRKSFIVGGSLSHETEIDWTNLITTQLIPHSDGLCSSVYRRPLTSVSNWPYDHQSCSSTSISTTCSSTALKRLLGITQDADGLPGWICIKRVSPDDQPSPHSISREISLLSTILLDPSHDNIAPLLCAIYDTSDPFGSTVDLIMPLYAATLEEVLNEPSLLPPSIFSSTCDFSQNAAVESRPGNSISHLWQDDIPTFIYNVTKQLLEGLHFLHAKRVAHRDVKPSNVLISHNGRLKLIDLGIAYYDTSFSGTRLRDPLLLEQDSAKGERGRGEGGKEGQGEGEGGGRMVHQVGTGVYRAPELLFSPKYGYDAFKLDIWACGVSLAEFFTSLTPSLAVSCSNEGSLNMPSLDVEPQPQAQQEEQEDERKDWQKAFDNSNPLLPPSSPSSSSSNSDFFWEEEQQYQSLSPSFPSKSTPSSNFTRTPLFSTHASKGDIPLASNIFSILPLPSSPKLWPEAIHFQPPLHRLPFTPPSTNSKNLIQSLPLYPNFSQSKHTQDVVNKVIIPSLKLSAAARPTAAQLLAALQV
ncbi:related to SGV1 - Cyclin-dependent protein kinase [Ustilago trichophora]|uniref:Related to SGV1 - Cyclin-dependent protein kinase n=1 Tax=Ustilago trichophora TaxID=86804 RepID=A0A5C3E537_9BASI|nr:related to SGV1 - Cyclin-dependent protein kinase [Ustilago trichophora]